MDLYLGFLVGVLTGASRFLHLERLREDACAAVLGRRGRQVVLRLSTTEAWLDRFQQALARILMAGPNCRAGLEATGHPALPFDG